MGVVGQPDPDLDRELQRARHLAIAADEANARELLLSLLPRIEAVDRLDLLLEALSQLGELYLERAANAGVVEVILRIKEVLGAHAASSPTEIGGLAVRYSRRVLFLEIGLAAARGDHESAASGLQALSTGSDGPDDLAEEHEHLLVHARILCGSALCDDDLHVRSVPLWRNVIESIDRPSRSEVDDRLLVLGATAYGRFCVETGRLAEAEPWLARAGARAHARRWELAVARTQLERATATWLNGEHAATQDLLQAAYPAIATHARAHDVSRCWLYFGLIRTAIGDYDAADDCFAHAERHWREVDKPLYVHRILLQRSWIDLFRMDFDAATARVAQARELLDAWPRHSWLQYARIDDHLGSLRRAEALVDPTQASVKLAQAVDLKVPAALAVDSVRHSMTGPGARMRWAATISARILAGALSTAWESGDTQLVGQLVEYHSARGSFAPPRLVDGTEEWTHTATTAVAAEALTVPGADDPWAEVNALARLGPLPPLVMDPGGEPVLSRHRALARERYGRDVTAAEPAWSTWP